MNYLLFNNDILMSDGSQVQRISKGRDPKDILGTVERARVCVVDVDLLITAAVEHPVEKKDSLLVRKFNQLYQYEVYVIQDERIDDNLFQVMGIKEQKVREIYSLIPPLKVESLIPYGIALRHTLADQNLDLNKTVVFVDDLGAERLLTVFDGLKFSRTRVIADNGEDLLPEIKRSQIDFFKKTEEYLSKKSADFVIAVNNRALADELSQNKEKPHVEYLDIPYPAIEGLKTTETSMKYLLPEENLKKRKAMELKKKIKTAILSLLVGGVGLGYYLFHKVEYALIHHRCALARQMYGQLDEQLRSLDQKTYRQDLKSHQSLNYGVTYLSMLEVIPAGYTVASFEFFKADRWHIAMTLFAEEGGMMDPIPRIKVLRNAEIKDVFVHNQPAKQLKLIL